jgi:hypothetical protein
MAAFSVFAALPFRAITTLARTIIGFTLMTFLSAFFIADAMAICESRYASHQSERGQGST